MSDLRSPEPDHRTFDMRKQTVGSDAWLIDIDVWPYSGIRSEKVYASKASFIVRAERATHAMGLADMLAQTIMGGHDVWQTRITSVSLYRGDA